MPAPFTPNPRTPPSALYGVREPLDLSTPRVKIEMDDEMYWTLPEATPLTVIMNKVRDTKRVENYKHEWLRKDEFPRSADVAADAVVGATTLYIPVADVDRVIAGHVLKNSKTEEVVWVSAVTRATGALTVTRSLNGVAKAMTAGETLVCIGTAFVDGSAKPDYQSSVETPDYNYTQIFRRGWGYTRRLKSLGTYGGKDPDTVEQEVAIEHRLDKEYACLFGARYYDATYAALGTVFSTCGGVSQFVKTNIWNVNHNIPEKADWFKFAEDAMRFGKGGYMKGKSLKFFFCSANWRSYFAEMFHDQVRYEPLAEDLGIVASSITTPHGKIVITHSPILDRFHQGYGFLIDPAHMRRVVFGEWDNYLEENIQTPGTAAEEHAYYSDEGWEFDEEAPHAIVYGLD